MKKGGKRTWSDEPLPLGTIRVHGGKRRIKVNVDGPKSQQWKDYARFWWENFKGPVPEGMRVVCLDGNPLNDAPDNLALMTGGEWIVHLRRIRPAVAAKNRRACAEARARFNRDVALVRRRHQRLWPKFRWYAVDLNHEVIFDRGYRVRWQALAAAGVGIEQSAWRFARRIMRSGPVIALRGITLREERYRAFTIVDPSPSRKPSHDYLPKTQSDPGRDQPRGAQSARSSAGRTIGFRPSDF